MRFTYDEEAHAFYLYVVDRIPAGAVAKTVQIVDGQVMIDVGKAGELLGVEVLNPELLGTVPEILKARDVKPPEDIDFKSLAKALSPPAAAAGVALAVRAGKSTSK